jgi:hypothetical protein
MNLGRGFVRLGVLLTALWFVYWTAAYVIRVPRSESDPFPGPVPSLTTGLILAPLVLAGVILALKWIADGFRLR